LSPRRIAILGSRGIPARYGGFETFAEELAVGLVERGAEVTVFCERSNGTPAREPAREHRGVRLVHVPAPRLGPLRTILFDLGCLWRARKGFDVVYMLGYGSALFCGLPRRSGSEVWINMDGLEWRRRKWGRLARAWLRWNEGRALAVATRVVFDADAVRADVLARRPARADVSVIEYGARPPQTFDPGVLEELVLRPREYYLVVCRIEPENHVLEIVTAFARLATDRTLLVVGNVDGAGEYGRACRQAAGRARVRFLGALFDGTTLDTLRTGSRAVLHGHSVGGTNPSLLEALAAGAPVIAHDNPFNREVLGAEATCFHDTESLIEALRVVEARDAEEHGRLGDEARARVTTYYQWERIVAAYATLLGAPQEAGGAEGAAPIDDPVPAPEPRAPLPGGHPSGTPARR
jgi:glycosyltransferase involved in cell wall biosynthesis